MPDEFQITLLSNVKSNPRNHAAEFETQLAKPIELNGQWEVALMDLSYPHNWVTLKDDYYVALFTYLAEDETPVVNTIEGTIVDDIRKKIIESKVLEDMQIRKAIRILAGNYTNEELTQAVQESIQAFRETKETTVKFDKNTLKVEMNTSEKFALVCFRNKSLLNLLGFSEQTSKVGDLEYLNFENDTTVYAKKTPIVEPFTVMLVYTDISEHCLVGDTQSPLLGYIPIVSKFGSQAHWCLNPVYYVKVKENVLTNITIKICTDQGELIPFEKGGQVICRLNFRKRNLF